MTPPLRKNMNALRVCVIGNSLTGAVYRAYRECDIADGYEFSFFAHPGLEYEKIKFEGHKIINTPFSNGGNPDMSYYDYFVVYGDLPTPSRCIRYWRALSVGTYSAQVRQAAFRDWLLLSKSARIMQDLGALSDKPVFGISENNLLYSDIGTRDDNNKGCELIGISIYPCIYIEFPDVLFDNDFVLNEHYYHGSLNVLGNEPDREVQPDHHHFHFNLAGGAVMLARIVERLRNW